MNLTFTDFSVFGVNGWVLRFPLPFEFVISFSKHCFGGKRGIRQYLFFSLLNRAFVQNPDQRIMLRLVI